MFFESTLCPGEIHVTRANIRGSIEPNPQYDCFTDQAVDWVKIHAEGLKALTSDSPEIAHYKKIAKPSVLA